MYFSIQFKRPNFAMRCRAGNLKSIATTIIFTFLLLSCGSNTTKNSAGGEAAAPKIDSPRLLWSDEFDTGTLPDPTYWSYDLGRTGWGNQEIQTYTSDPSNVQVEGGSLLITALEHEMEGGRKRYTSARVKTKGKFSVMYGIIEARVRIPDLADGLWPAIWTLGHNYDDVGWPASGELDIMEMGSSEAISAGVVNRRVGSHAHWEHRDKPVDYGGTLDAVTDLSAGFHVFRMEWTPVKITTYLDGAQIWAMDITSTACTDCTEFHQPHFLIVNMAVGGDYTELSSWRDITATFPAVLEVDWIRVYDNGHTQIGGLASSGS